MSRAQRVVDLLLLPAILIALAWEPNFRHGFINYNESGQHLVAMRELANGSLLFRDVFAQYGPLHYFVPVWAAAWFGESIATLRGYFLVGEIVGFLALWGLSRALIPNRLFAAAAAIVAVVFAHHPFWSTRWGGFRFAFVYLSLWCLVALLQERRVGLLVLAGVFAALGFLHTYDAGAAAAVGAVVAFACMWTRSELRDGLLRDIGFYAAGVVACLLPFLFYLVATGTLGDYLAQLPLLNPGRAWVQPIPDGTVTATVLAPAFIYALGLSFASHVLRRDAIEAPRVMGFLVVIGAGLLLYAASFRAIRGPQFETSLPLAAVALLFLVSRCFALFERMDEPDANRRAGWMGFAFVVLAMMAIGVGEIRTYGGGLVAWSSYQLGKFETVARHTDTRQLNEGYRAVAVSGAGAARIPEPQAREIEEIVEYVQSATSADDAILGYPDLGIFNYFADRPQATRFAIPILAAADPRYTEEILSDVRKGKPELVLIGNQRSTLARATGHEGEYLPELSELVRERYHLEQHFRRLDVYRINAGSGS